MQVVRCLLIGTVAGLVIGCVEDDPSSLKVSTNPQYSEMSDREGEVMGNVYGMEGSAYYVQLEPYTPEEGAWVRGSHSWTMWVDPNKHGGRNYMFEWGDPDDAGTCGSIDTYATRTGEEVHYNAGVKETGVEKHCIRPGTYWLRLRNGSPTGVVVKEVLIDYLGAGTLNGSAVNVSDLTSGKTQSVAEMRSSPAVFDCIVHFDLAGGSPAGVTSVLDIENATSNRLKNWFQDQSSPSGSELDHFRASVARSASAWAKHDKGTFMAKLFWDGTRTDKLVTNWYNPRHGDLWMLRTMQYGDSIKTSRNVSVGMGILRPDGAPSNSVLAPRSVTVSRTAPAAPIANVSVQSISTWKSTDQYLNVGTSDRGANYRYSWSFDNGLTWLAETTDTLVDFPGHSVAGSQSVMLRVRDTSNGLTTQASRTIAVENSTVTLTGNQYITTKTSNAYTSSIVADWFDRWNADPPNWEWLRRTPAGFPTDSLNIIWPAGCYTVELRQQDSTAQLLKRGRKSIAVNNTTGCANFNVAGASMSSLSTQQDESGSSVYGAGPVLSWGSANSTKAVRLYDLMGAHESSTFGNREWLARDGGVESVTSFGDIQWTKLDLALNDVTAFRFQLTPLDRQAYVFGFAVDPDLGSDAGDDQTGFDAVRNMTYAVDGEKSFGIILLNSQMAGPSSIWQYGAARFSPSDYSSVWKAQRAAGRRMLAGRGDAQFVISSPTQIVSGSYTVLLIEGNTLGDLQVKADAARSALK